MIVETLNNTKYVRFKSLKEVFNIIDNEKCLKIYNKQIEKFYNWDKDRLIEWFGVKDKEHYFNVIEQGDKSHLNEINNIIENINYHNKPLIKNRKKIKSNFGDMVDIQQIYNGNLDKAWTKTISSKREGNKFIKLFLNICRPWNTPSQVYKYSGVLLISLYIHLSILGYMVSIEALIHSESVDCSNQSLFSTFSVKDYTTPIDIITLTTYFSNPSFYRTLGFAVHGLCDGIIQEGLGAAVLNPNTSLRTYKENYPYNNETFIFLDNDLHSIECVNSSLEAVLEKLNSQM